MPYDNLAAMANFTNEPPDSYLGKLNSMLAQLKSLLGDINTVITSNPTLKAYLDAQFAAHQADIDSRLKESAGLSQPLKGNGLKALNFADSDTPTGLVTLQQAQALLSLGGSPTNIGITALNPGTLQRGQTVRAKTDGSSALEPETWGTPVTAARTCYSGEALPIDASGGPLLLTMAATPTPGAPVLFYRIDSSANDVDIVFNGKKFTYRSGSSFITDAAATFKLDVRGKVVALDFFNDIVGWRCI